MSEAVDTRIVEAKFDSSQFEKGVDRTVKKLDELKKSMTFEETGKSIADLTSKAQEATEKASNSLEKLENRITSFTGMLRQKLLSGIADEIVGVFFKFENGVKSLISTLTSGQMSTGMQRYSDLLTSIRVLTMSGVEENSAYKTMERLTDYADQTSYSLDEMVSTMSKFKTAGASLATAERMVVGLSNAAASMGVNAQQAQRAYLNMQQAYSKGFMQQNDWISFESLPMVGEKFNQAILDAAVKTGTLVADKIDKATGKAISYKTSRKEDKNVRTSGSDARGITAENMGQKLSSRWFNKKVMEEVFGQTYYFSLADDAQINELKDLEKQLKQQVKDGLITEKDMDEQFQNRLNEIAKERAEEKKSELDEMLKQGKIDIKQYDKLWKDFEASNHFTKFGWDAFRAGQEARSFADILNMLKDVISRGWAKSFEIIFGKLEEASKFFTELADNAIIRAIRSIIDFRNEVLQTWADDGGRTAFIETLQLIDNILEKIFGQFTIFGDDEKEVTKKAHNLGDTLFQSTLKIKQAVITVKNWLEEVDPITGESRLKKIANLVNTIKNIFNGVMVVVGIAFTYFGKTIKTLSPLFDSFGGILQKVLDAVEKLMNPKKDEKGAFSSLRNGLDNILKIAEPFVSILSTVLDVLGDVAGFFVEIATGTFAANIQFFSDILGFVLELFGQKSAQAENGVGVIEGIKNEIIAFGEGCKNAIEFVGKFFENLFKDLEKLLGIKSETDGVEEGGFFSNIINFFQTNEFIKNVKAWIDKAIVDIGDFIKSIPDRIVKLADDLWNTINGILWNKNYSENSYQNIKRYSSVDAEKYKESMKTPFYNFVEGLINNIKDFIVSLPDKIVELVGKAGDFITNIINTVFDFFFKEQDYSEKETDVPNDVIKDAQDGLETGFDHIKNIVINFIKSIPEKIGNIFRTLASTAGKIAEKIWNFIDELLFGKKVRDFKWDSKNKKMVWVTRRIKTGLSKWLDDLSKSVKEFFTNPEKIKEVWNKILDFFFGRQATEEDTNTINPQTGETYKLTERVKEGFSLWLDNTITTVKNWILTIPEKFANIWNTIIDFIFGRQATEADTGTINPVTGENYKPTERVKEGFSLWIHDIWTKIKTWFTSGQILKDIEGIWNKVVDFIFGKEQTFTVVKPQTGEEHQVTKRVKEGFSKWLEDTIKVVVDWFGSMNDRIRGLWNQILGAIFGSKEANGFSQSIYDKLLNYDSKSANAYKDHYTKKSGLVTQVDEWLKSVGIDIGKMIRNLPTYIVEGWNFSVDLFGDLLKHIDEWLKGKNDQEVLEKAEKAEDSGFFKAVVELGQKIKNLIVKTIPSILTEGFTFLGNQSGQLTDSIVTMFTGIDWDKVGDSAQKVADGIVKTIEGIPDAIRGTVEWLKNLFSGRGNLIKEALKTDKTVINSKISTSWLDDFANGYRKGSEGFKNYIESQNKKLRKNIANGTKGLTESAVEGISDESSGFNLWETIKDIGKAIGDALVKLGPDILSGVNSAFIWINDQISNFTQKLAEKPDDTPFFEWLTGLIGGKDKQSSGLATVIQNIGKTLKTLIIETIPKFLGEAFAELAAGIPRFFNSLFGGGNEETEAVAEEVGKELGGSNVETIAKGYTEGFNEQAKVVMKNAGGGFDLSWLFSWMNPIGSANAEDEFPTEDSKNMINKQEKITEISKKLEEEQAKQTEALNKNNASDYFRATKNIEVYQKMLTILKECEGEMIDASVLNKAGKIEEAEEKVSIITQILKRIGEIFNSLTDVNTIKTAFVIAAIGVILWSLKTIIDQVAVLDDIGYTIKWTGITVGILGIVGLIGYLIHLGETGQEDKLKKIKETFESVKGLITSFMGLVVAIRGLGVVKGIADIGKVVKQASTITDSVVTTNVTKGTFGQGFGQGIGGVLGKLVSALSTGGFIWLILQQLPTLIESVADAKAKLKASGADENFGSDMFYVMGGVAAVLASTSVIGIGLAAIQKISPSGLDPMATLNTVLSLVEIVTGASLVITAIQGLNSLLEKYLGPGKDVFSGFKELGETVASMLTSLGKGIGGFIQGLLYGETAEEHEARKQESVEKMFNLLVEASKEMPIEQLETIVSLTERMVGLYERLDGLGTRTENVKTILAATDVAGTFRTISQAVLEILTAFDTAEQEQYKILGKAATKRDFFGGDQNNYTTEDFANDLTEGYDLASRDYSVWKSFAEGGSAYEAIQQYVNILSDVVSSLSGAISPNLIDLLSKDTQTYDKFWERLNKFFMGSDGENSGFSDVIEYIKTAYATIEANYEALKPYTDSKYSNIIDAINNLFSIFMNLMPEGDTAVAVLTQGSTEEGPYAKWYFRIRNMLDWGPSGSQNDFEDLIQRVVEAYKILGKYDAQLSQYKNANFIGLIQGIYNVFGMFSQDDGVGSGTWLDNYMAFKKKLNESGFIENYVKDLEKIFEAFKTSALYDPETGMMGSLYFDGASIVKNLFDAINTGLQSENLPELDASAVGDAILKAIRVSDKELEIAKAVHQMIQDGLLTFNTNTELGSFDTSGMSEMSEAMKQLLEQFSGAENGIMTLFGSDEGIAKINNTVKDLSGSMSPENILGEDSETWIKEMQDILNAAGLDEETLNPKITPVLEITDDFTNKVNTMRQMLGYNPMQEVNGVLDMSWRLADAIKIPEQYDYTEKLDIIIDHMGTLNNSVSEFNDSMSNMTIAVDGEELGTTIYPFVEKAAGWNLVTNQRPGVDE